MFRTTLELTLPSAVTTRRAERVLIAAVQSVPGVLDATESPSVFVRRSGEEGISYSLRFWIDQPDDEEGMRYQAWKAILDHLDFTGIALPDRRYVEPAFAHAVPSLQAHRTGSALFTEPSPGWGALLRKIEIFSPLADADLETLGRRVREQEIQKGQDVVQQGRTGASLFIVREGLLNVFVFTDNWAELKVGQLGPGEFLGEMALLTGAPRSATVRAVTEVVTGELLKEDLEPLLHERAHLAEGLSQVLADRQMRNQATLAATKREADALRSSLAGEALGKIVSFFGLRRPAAQMIPAPPSLAAASVAKESPRVN